MVAMQVTRIADFFFFFLCERKRTKWWSSTDTRLSVQSIRLLRFEFTEENCLCTISTHECVLIRFTIHQRLFLSLCEYCINFACIYLQHCILNHLRFVGESLKCFFFCLFLSRKFTASPLFRMKKSRETSIVVSLCQIYKI